MFFTHLFTATATAALSLVSVSSASAISLPVRHNHDYDPFAEAFAFRLVTNISDPRADKTYQGRGVHVTYTASGVAHAVPVPRTVPGAVFYLVNHANLTSHGTVLTELSGGPNMIFSLSIGANGVVVADGPAGSPVSRTGFPELLPGVAARSGANFALCKKNLAFSNGVEEEVMTVVLAGLATPGCQPVNLLAECEALHEVPEGSRASEFHKAAQKVWCYKDIGGRG